MANTEKVRTRIQALDERVARLRTEKHRLIARASQSERKRDTRRKILIGGAVLAAVDHEGVPALRTKAALLQWLDERLSRPNDRALRFTAGARNGRQEPALRPYEPRGPQRSGRQGCRPVGGTAERRGASLTAA